MHDLEPITPLGGRDPRIDIHGPVTIAEITDMALASVAARLGHETGVRSTLGKLLGSEVPGPSRGSAGTISAFWIAQDQWMIEAPVASHEDLAGRLAERLVGEASVTEQTDAWCRFDLTGPSLSSIMELLCVADTSVWQGGEVQRTVIDHMGCYLLCRAREHMSVIGPRSLAASLHHALLTACKSAV